MSNLKYLIVYHKEDNDGVLSAAIFMDYLIKKSVDSTDINMCGYTYGELMNEDINKWNQIYDHIIMLDISFNDYKKMIQLKKDFGKNFCWIDHHSPIIVESIFRKFDDINGVRQTDRSTILLKYKYLYDPFDEKYHNKTCPELFRILSAYDSWTYEQEGYHFDEVDNINKAVTFESELDIRNMMKYINIDNATEDSEIKRLEKIGSLLTDYDRFRYKRLISDYEDVWRIDNGDGTFLNCSVLFTQ